MGIMFTQREGCDLVQPKSDLQKTAASHMTNVSSGVIGTQGGKVLTDAEFKEL